jgi:transposase
VVAKENRKSLDGRWKKNDPRDAYNVTDLIFQGKMFYYREDPLSDNLKGLLKIRKQAVNDLSSIKIRLRNNHFAQYFPEIDGLYKDITHQEVIMLLKHFPTSEHIRDIDFDYFYNIVKCKPLTKLSKERIKTVWEKAQYSIGRPKNNASALAIKLILEDIQRLKRIIRLADDNIYEICGADKNYPLLRTIPGFGPVLTSIFMAYVGDIDNYYKAGQLCKLSGLDLEYTSSGKYHSQANISKKGCSLLRYALCEAALKSLKNKIIKQYFKTKLMIKGSSQRNKAHLRIKLADKLLRSAFAVLKKQQPFDIYKFVGPVN